MGSQNRVLKYICFPMETEHFLGKTTKKDSVSLRFTMFSERDFRLAENEVSPWEKLRKWEVRIAFWNTIVFQWKRITFLAILQKGVPFLLRITMFSERDPRHLKTLWKQMVFWHPWDPFFSGYPEISFRESLTSRIPGSLELPEISFREGGFNSSLK